MCFFQLQLLKYFSKGRKCSGLMRTVSAYSCFLLFAQFLEWAGPGFCLECVFTWYPYTPGSLWTSPARYHRPFVSGSTLCLESASGRIGGFGGPSSALLQFLPLCALSWQHCSSPLGLCFAWGSPAPLFLFSSLPGNLPWSVQKRAGDFPSPTAHNIGIIDLARPSKIVCLLPGNSH